MRSSSTAALLMICLSCTQRFTALAQTPGPAPQPSTLTVPAQTVVPLTLVNPIKNKSTKPGDSVRAVVAFPVTVGDRLAIPAGTYVEGTLLPPIPKVKHQPDPGTQLHFTRLVFANGYSVPLDATQAEVTSPILDPAAMADTVAASRLGKGVLALMGYAGGQTTFPAVTPPPSTGPSPGIFIGATLGGLAATIAIAIAFHHKAGSSDFILHDAGWQFQMKLASPLTLDPSLIAAAVAVPTAAPAK